MSDTTNNEERNIQDEQKIDQNLKEIISKNNEYKLLESVKDYGGNDRVVICRFLEK